MKVLVTGGAGYIGSTIASCCIDEGIVPVVLDDLSTGRPEFVRDRVFYEGDCADEALLGRIFDEHDDIAAVVHCAAKIVVPESMARPLDYYRTNVASTIALVDVLCRTRDDVRLLFSSSASVYRPTGLEADEAAPLAPDSPYARTKMVVDLLLADVARADASFRAVSLRYFNPIGADPRLRTGHQHPRPTHLLAKLMEARREDAVFTLAGDAWPTRDGSALRDYVHVWDLARAHVRALRRFEALTSGEGHRVVNLGTGTGTTVKEMVAAFEHVTGQPLRVAVAAPRPGDVVGGYASTAEARRLLDWAPRLTISDGIRDALRWEAVKPTVLG